VVSVTEWQGKMMRNDILVQRRLHSSQGNGSKEIMSECIKVEMWTDDAKRNPALLALSNPLFLLIESYTGLER